MRTSAAIVAFTALAVSAQGHNYTSSLDMTIDPGTVEPALRSQWCTAQSNTCFELCDDRVETNDCDMNDLSYECICTESGEAPALEDYTQTMPTFICQTLFKQCNEANVGDARAQSACEENIQSLCATESASDGEDDDGDDSEDASTTEGAATSTATDPPTETETNDEESEVTTTNSDGFAAPTAAPKGVAALAAMGLMAALV